MKRKTNVLILGASGMLGNTVMRYLSSIDSLSVSATVRSLDALKLLPKASECEIIDGIDADEQSDLFNVINTTKPDCIINCIGVVKQLTKVVDPSQMISINSLLPHRLASLASEFNCRLITISTDCVFSGSKGEYVENDFPDANDLYGRSKLLGEIDYGNSITLRVSMIGHELSSSRGLIDWFLSQEEAIHGYTGAIFSGLPTIEIARVISKFVLPNPDLKGLYHLSGESISKYELLNIVSEVYKKNIEIIPFDEMAINRSLNSDMFQDKTGYSPKPWSALIEEMHRYG